MHRTLRRAATPMCMVVITLMLPIIPAVASLAHAAPPAPAGLQRMVVSPPEARVAVTESVILSAQGFDANGTQVDLTNVTWSLEDPSLGTVVKVNASAAEFSAGERAGATRIYVESSGVRANASITIIPGEAVELTLTTGERTVRVGESLALSAVGKDEFGNIVPGERYTWSVDSLYYGHFQRRTGAKAVLVAGTITGEMKVRVESGSARKEVSVSILPGEPSGITLTPTQLEIDSLERTTVHAYLHDAFGNVIPEEVNFTWSSSHGFARVVSSTGDSVTIEVVDICGEVCSGPETIQVTYGGFSANATVRVRPALWLISGSLMALLTVVIAVLVRWKTRVKCPECGAAHWRSADTCKVCETPMVATHG